MIDITKVRPLDPRCLQLEFADGLQAVVDLDQVIGQYKGVFLLLLDADYFRQVRLNQELRTIVWPNGADLETACIRFGHQVGGLPPAVPQREEVEK